MKFFTLVILPAGTDIRSEEAVSRAIRKLMAPYQCPTVAPDGDADEDFARREIRPRWDYYLEHPVEMLRHWGAPVAPEVSDDDRLMLAVDTLTPADFRNQEKLGAPDILTPAGEWIEGHASSHPMPRDWETNLDIVLAQHRGHHATLLLCHY